MVTKRDNLIINRQLFHSPMKPVLGIMSHEGHLSISSKRLTEPTRLPLSTNLTIMMSWQFSFLRSAFLFHRQVFSPITYLDC